MQNTGNEQDELQLLIWEASLTCCIQLKPGGRTLMTDIQKKKDIRLIGQRAELYVTICTPPWQFNKMDMVVL